MFFTIKTILTVWIEIQLSDKQIKIDSNPYFELDIPPFVQHYSLPQ